MKSISISGTVRENEGKTYIKQLRKEEKVPCVLYGGKENVLFAVDSRSFKNLIYTPEVCTVKLDVNGKEYNAVLQEAQFHPVTENILHADFLELSADKPVKIAIPVKTIGNPVGVLLGGRLIVSKRKILVKALIQDLPDFVEVDISNLGIGDSIKVCDINITNVEILEREREEVIGVKVTRIVEEVVEETTSEAAEGATEGAAAEGGADKAADKEGAK